jgi:hypothetical protein
MILEELLLKQKSNIRIGILDKHRQVLADDDLSPMWGTGQIPVVDYLMVDGALLIMISNPPTEQGDMKPLREYW